MSYALRGERLIVLDSIQGTYSDDGHGDGRLLVSRLANQTGGGSPGLLDHLSTIVVAGKAQTQAKAEEFFAQAIRLSALPAWERSADPFNLDSFVSGLGATRRYPVLLLALPGVSKSLRVGDQIRLDESGTRLMLALEQFRRRTGAYPNDLSELVTTDLPDLYIDPMTGGPFRYRLQAPGEGDPRGYLLYTHGADQTDNGGLMKPGENYSALAPGKADGFDYIVNELRATPAAD